MTQKSTFTWKPPLERPKLHGIGKKSRFPLAGVSLGAQYRPPLGQSLQCWRPNPGFDIVKQANLHYQPKYSTCRSSSAGCPPEPRLALACRPEDYVLYISRKALISAWFEVLKPLRIFLTDLLWCHLLPQTDPPCTCVSTLATNNRGGRFVCPDGFGTRKNEMGHTPDIRSDPRKGHVRDT